ncbi:MAG: hypothetical protein ACO35E_02905 [Ilumatobacteraceae bacterium]|jgi:F-type H+-transporting ATPase subunit b
MIGIIIAAGEIDPAQSVNWLLPPTAEIIYGGLASIVIFALLYKFAGPSVRTALADRTAKIQADLDGAQEALSTSAGEAADIRRAAGDIAAERERLLSEARAQADALRREGRARLDAEIAELDARSEAELIGASGRLADELRLDISRLSAEVADRLIAETLDSATQQALIESFIQKVGASS